MKLCVNCRHYVPGLDKGTDRCNHLDTVRIEPVRGTMVMGFCDLNRSITGVCGYEGKLFTDKNNTEPGESEHV